MDTVAEEGCQWWLGTWSAGRRNDPSQMNDPVLLDREHAHEAIRWEASTYGDTVVTGSGCSVLLRRWEGDGRIRRIRGE
jgi:hypothetical protein